MNTHSHLGTLEGTCKANFGRRDASEAMEGMSWNVANMEPGGLRSEVCDPDLTKGLVN